VDAFIRDVRASRGALTSTGNSTEAANTNENLEIGQALSKATVMDVTETARKPTTRSQVLMWGYMGMPPLMFTMLLGICC
jgi:hypothetical protein